MLKRDISLKHAYYFEKPYAQSRTEIQVNSTSSLSQYHVHHKTYKIKSSLVNMHFIIINHIIKTTLCSSYNINKHVQEYIISSQKQDPYSLTPSKSTSATTK